MKYNSSMFIKKRKRYDIKKRELIQYNSHWLNTELPTNDKNL